MTSQFSILQPSDTTDEEHGLRTKGIAAVGFLGTSIGNLTSFGPGISRREIQTKSNLAAKESIPVTGKELVQRNKEFRTPQTNTLEKMKRTVAVFGIPAKHSSALLAHLAAQCGHIEEHMWIGHMTVHVVFGNNIAYERAVELNNTTGIIGMRIGVRPVMDSAPPMNFSCETPREPYFICRPSRFPRLPWLDAIVDSILGPIEDELPKKKVRSETE